MLFSTTSFSQIFNGGGYIGFSVSQVDGDSLGGYNKSGFVAGGFVNTEIKENLHFQFEFKWIQKGSKTDKKIETSEDYYELQFNYIEMPFLIKYYYKEKIIFETGLAEGYLFKAQEDTDGYGFREPGFTYKKLETSFLAGISYMLLNNLFVNARLNYSIIPITNQTAGGRGWIKKGQFNNVLSFTVYYQL